MTAAELRGAVFTIAEGMAGLSVGQATTVRALTHRLIGEVWRLRAKIRYQTRRIWDLEEGAKELGAPAFPKEIQHLREQVTSLQAKGTELLERARRAEDHFGEVDAILAEAFQAGGWARGAAVSLPGLIKGLREGLEVAQMANSQPTVSPPDRGNTDAWETPWPSMEKAVIPRTTDEIQAWLAVHAIEEYRGEVVKFCEQKAMSAQSEGLCHPDVLRSMYCDGQASAFKALAAILRGAK
jgi:hypothetical protein